MGSPADTAVAFGWCRRPAGPNTRPLGHGRVVLPEEPLLLQDDAAGAEQAYRELMRWQTARLRGADPRRVTAALVVPPLVLLAWAQLDIWTSHVVSGSRVLMSSALVGVAVALVFRQRAPFVALCLTGAGVLLPAALGTTVTSAPAVFLLVLATFAAGRYGASRLSIAALPVAVGIALVGGAAGPEDSLSSTWAWSLNMVWIWGLGRWLREADRRVEATRRQSKADARAVAAEERLRVARDLHDVLAHSLSIIVVQAEVADELLSSDPEGARRAIRNIQGTGRGALDETRGVLGLLRQAEGVSHAGLTDLPGLVEVFRSAGLPVTLEAEPGLRLSADAEAGIYRMVQEALTNALRHSGAQATSVRLALAAGGVTVQVDNGGRPRTARSRAPVPGKQGQGPKSVADHRRASGRGPGHGLEGMRERIEACGGRLESGPLPDGGFRVRADLPGTVLLR